VEKIGLFLIGCRANIRSKDLHGKLEKMKSIICTLTVALSLSACASASNVYEMAPGVYTVTATGDGYTTADRVTDLAMGKAQEQCGRSGKRVRVVDEAQSRTRMGIDTTLKLRFQCV
jgi:hypothetical protein